MGIYIAEYLGQRTDSSLPIKPYSTNDTLCPFNGLSCRKIASQDKKSPVCSLRRNNEVYIVCEERLISTRGFSQAFTSYQKQKILEVARFIFNPSIAEADVGIKTEVPIKIPGRRGYLKADFIVRLLNQNIQTSGPKGVIMEVQGGGETSNTGTMQRHVKDWERNPLSNSYLRQNLPKVGPIQTNAWRRLQEQMFVKGAIAKQTGFGFVACVGPLLYDIAQSKFRNVKDLQNEDWEIALITFDEDLSQPVTSGPIPLKVDSRKVLFTSFTDIATAIAEQGVKLPKLFEGHFINLLGQNVIIP